MVRLFTEMGTQDSYLAQGCVETGDKFSLDMIRRGCKREFQVDMSNRTWDERWEQIPSERWGLRRYQVSSDIS